MGRHKRDENAAMVYEVRREPNGYFYLHWKGPVPAGRQSLDTKDSAEAYLAAPLVIKRMEADRLAAKFDADKVIPPNTLLKSVLRHYRVNHIRENDFLPTSKVREDGQMISIKSAEFSIILLESYFGDIELFQLSSDHLNAYKEKRMVGLLGEKKIPVKLATVNRELASLRAAINFFCEGKIIPFGFIKPGVARFKKPKKRKTDPLKKEVPPEIYEIITAQHLEAEELERLMTAALQEMPSDTYRFGWTKKPSGQTRVFLFIILAFCTGGRTGRIEHLRWSRQVFLNIEGQKQRAPGLTYGYIKLQPDDEDADDDNKKGATVPISAYLYPHLVQAYKERTNDYVLGHPGEIRRAFENACLRAGFIDPTRQHYITKKIKGTPVKVARPTTWVTPYILRHSFATIAIAEGKPMSLIAETLGDSEETLKRFYAHLRARHLEPIVNLRGTDRLPLPRVSQPGTAPDEGAERPARPS